MDSLCSYKAALGKSNRRTARIVVEDVLDTCVCNAFKFNVYNTNLEHLEQLSDIRTYIRRFCLD